MKAPCCYQAISKLIMVKSIVGIILCLCVLCNYAKSIKYTLLHITVHCIFYTSV